MNTHEMNDHGSSSSEPDDELRLKLRPAIAELIDEADARSATAPDRGSIARRLRDGRAPVDVEIRHDGTQSDRAGAGAGPGRKVLALAAAVALIFGGVVALGIGRGRSVRVTDDSVPSAAGSATEVGGLFPDASFTGEYAVIDPNVVPDLDGVQPSTMSNVDRWLIGTGDQNHWMVPVDNITSEQAWRVGGTVGWRAPVPAPPDWLIGRGKSARQVSEGDGTLITIQTLDGTWLEVRLGADYRDQPGHNLEPWIASLGLLDTATDIAPPTGFVEVPSQAEEFSLSYALAGTPVVQDGRADAADVADDAEEVPWLNLITVRFDEPLDETQVLYWFSAWGKPEPAAESPRVGELFSLVNPAPLDGGSDTIQYGWRVSPHLLVWIRAGGPSMDERLPGYLRGLTLSTVDTPPPTVRNAFSGGALDSSVEASGIRSGDLGQYRFVYLATTRAPFGIDQASTGPASTAQADRDQAGCEHFVVGGPWNPGGCVPAPSEPEAPLCVYQVAPAGDLLWWGADGYVLTLLADADIADRVRITNGGGPPTADSAPTGGSATAATDATDTDATSATIADAEIAGADTAAHVAAGTPVETDDITGVSDGRRWVAKSARVPSVPTVVSDGFECRRMP